MIAIWVWLVVGMRVGIDMPFHMTVLVYRDASGKITSCQSDSITLPDGICDKRTHLTVAPPSNDGIRIPLSALELACEPEKVGVKLWIKCKTD